VLDAEAQISAGDLDLL